MVNHPSRQRQIVRRTVITASGMLLLLVVYLASGPSLFYWSEHYAPQAIPALLAVYEPARAYTRNPEWLGSQDYAEYSRWGYEELSERLRGNPESAAQLDSGTTLMFSGTSLRDVVQHLGELHDYPIELDSEVDGDAEVTITVMAPLRDALKTMLDPLGLAAWPAKNRIVIGTPERINRIRAADAAQRPIARGAWMLLGLFVLSAGPLVLLLFRRRRPEPAPDRPGSS